MTITQQAMTDSAESDDLGTRLALGIEVDTHHLRAAIDGEEFEAADRRQLESELGRRLYERRHVRRDRTTPISHARRDAAVEEALVGAIGTRTISLPAQDPCQIQGRSCATVLGLRVHLDGEFTDQVQLPDVWPAMSPGFLMVFGTERPVSAPDRPLWRIYLAAEDLDGATPSFRVAVNYLRGNASRWQAKVASAPEHYPRSDAVTVYLDETEQHHIEPLVDAVTTQAPPRPAHVSQYAHPLAAGIGLAQEPYDPDPRRAGLSYGQHRASLVARYLISEAERPGNDFAELLRSAGVDPRAPWRNLRT